MSENKLLDCGHAPSPHNECSTGTARTEDGREICWKCSHEQERAFMRKHGKTFAYLNSEGTAVTDWPGKPLSDRVRILGTSRDNFGGERTYLRFVFEGEVWSGYAMGRGMYGRFRRTKMDMGRGL